MKLVSIHETLRALSARFDRARLDAPALLARRLAAHVLQQPREWLVTHDDLILSAEQLHHLEALAQRALSREPLAYIVQSREFYGMCLYVDHRVLVPRPETEMLVELAREEITAQGSALSTRHFIIEIGTGSGAAAIAIARELPAAQIIATDVSADALEVAKLNAKQQGVLEHMTFLRSDLLRDVPDALLAQIGVLVANLPYVAADEIDALQPEIANHEPRVALDGGPDGLHLIRELLTQLRTRALPHCTLRAAFLEHGASQGPIALATAQHIFPEAQCATIKDLAGLDRVLAVKF